MIDYFFEEEKDYRVEEEIDSMKRAARRKAKFHKMKKRENKAKDIYKNYSPTERERGKLANELTPDRDNRKEMGIQEIENPSCMKNSRSDRRRSESMAQKEKEYYEDL